MDAAPQSSSNVQTWLSLLVESGGSDLHLVAGSAPRVRVDSRVRVLADVTLAADDVKRLIEESLSRKDDSRPAHGFCAHEAGDYTIHLEALGRFRCHPYWVQSTPALSVRFLPFHIPSFTQLGLPQVVGDLTRKIRGLVLVTGPTGSGKSTTVASLLEKINLERGAHIVTLEQPIEFLLSPHNSLISQHEIDGEPHSFSHALKRLSRKMPDVVMLGELRDPEVIDGALNVVESGHLVFATLSASSCLQALQRIVHAFPVQQQAYIRHRLASALEGILSQLLLPQHKSPGRALALEILLPTPAVRNLIRDDKVSQIYSVMQTGQAKYGMQTLNQALADLYRRRLISVPTALAHSIVSDELQQLLTRMDARWRSQDKHEGRKV